MKGVLVGAFLLGVLLWALRQVQEGGFRLEAGGVAYLRQGVGLFAELCRPRGTPRGAVLLVPGGFGPPNPTMAERCRAWAERGFLGVVPHLRGRGGSGGRITGCLEEGEDLAHLARFLPRLGVRRHAYLGYSLGACVALKAAALERGSSGVVFAIGPVDFEEQARILERTRPEALARWREVFGEDLARQSPLPHAARLRAPLLILQAGNDPLIPPTQACRLRDLREATGRRVHQVALTREGAPWTGPLTKGRACLRPTGFGPLGEDHLILFPDLHHAVVPAMEAQAERFLLYWLRP